MYKNNKFNKHAENLLSKIQKMHDYKDEERKTPEYIQVDNYEENRPMPTQMYRH